MSDLPKGWEITDVESVGGVQYGYTASATKKDTGIKLLRITDIQDNRVDWASVPFCQIAHDKVQTYLLSESDLLFARTGATVGKSFLIQAEPPRAVFASYLIRLRFQKPLQPTYIYYYFQSNNYWRQIQESSVGIGQPNVNGTKLAKITFPIAPVKEQQRIVAKLEELFSDLDAATAALERVQANLKRYRASVLKSAVEGKLTAEWRDKNPPKETGAQLLERILRERREMWEARTNKKYKSPEPRDEDSNEYPDSWAPANLGHIAWSIKDGPHYSPNYSTDGIPFISGGNIRPHGIDFENAKFISHSLHAELSRRCLPEFEDVLYTKGGTTGIARVNTYERPFNVWVHVAVLKIIPAVRPFYVQHTLNSPFCHVQAQRHTHGVGNQDLGLTRMVRITLPVPPLEEQDEIIKAIDTQFSALDKIDECIDFHMKRANSLRQSLLKQAYEGKLVPQDQNDEPASALLKRIQEERASAVANKPIKAEKKERKPETKSMRSVKKPKSVTSRKRA